MVVIMMTIMTSTARPVSRRIWPPPPEKRLSRKSAEKKFG